MSKFVDEALKDAEKSTEQILKEKVQEFVELSQIDCEMQLNNADGELRKLLTNQRKIEKNVEKLKESFETARFQHATSFKEYIERRNKLKKELFDSEQELKKNQQEISNLKNEIVEWKVVLCDLNS